MRVPKGTIPHEQNQELEAIDVHAAVLRARRATEEIEWQAQVKRAKEALTESEADEWAALRARSASTPVDSAVRRAPPKKPAKPGLTLARVPKALEQKAPDNRSVGLAVVAPVSAPSVSEREAEEREWQELRARAQELEEREWAELIARARAQSARPAPRRAAPRGAVIAWP